jgi:hypothetical protein
MPRAGVVGEMSRLQRGEVRTPRRRCHTAWAIFHAASQWSRCCHIHCTQLESGSGNCLMLGGLIHLTGEFNGRRMLRRDVDAIMPLS